MKRFTLLFLPFFCLSFSQGQGQSNQKSIENLDYFENKTLAVYEQILELHKRILLHDVKRIKNYKQEMLYHLSREKEAFEKKEMFNGQERLKQVFIQFIKDSEEYLQYEPDVLIQYSEDEFSDSIHFQQNRHLARLELLCKKATGLQEEIERFCVTNKVVGRKQETPINNHFLMMKNLVKYACQIHNIVMEIRINERQCVKLCSLDSLEAAEKWRISLINSADQGAHFLSSLPTYFGDRSLIICALHSIKQYRKEANHDLAKVLNMKKREFQTKQKSKTEDNGIKAANNLDDKKHNQISPDNEKVQTVILETIEKERALHEDAFAFIFSEFLNHRMKFQTVGK